MIVIWRNNKEINYSIHSTNWICVCVCGTARRLGMLTMNMEHSLYTCLHKHLINVKIAAPGSICTEFLEPEQKLTHDVIFVHSIPKFLIFPYILWLMTMRECFARKKTCEYASLVFRKWISFGFVTKLIDL